MRMSIIVYVIYAILMYLYIHTFYYLKKAENTGCFNPKTVNLKFMEFFQILEIIAVTIAILFFPSFTKNIKNKKKYINLTLISGLALALINMYMAFNVYNFYYELKQCSIMNSWNKWWLYWEGIIAAISSIRVILAFLLFAMIGLKVIGLKLKK